MGADNEGRQVMDGAHAPAGTAGRGADSLRIVVGLVWLAGAAFNAIVTLRMAEPFSWLEASPIAPYRWFFREVAGSRPGLWTALLVAGEATMGALTLARGRWVTLGLGLGTAFSVFLFTLATPYTLVMGAWAALLGWLARREYPTSPFDRVLYALTGQRRGTPKSPA